MEEASEFKYLGCVLNESGSDVSECYKKLVWGRKVAGTIKSLFNARGLKLEYASVV